MDEHGLEVKVVHNHRRDSVEGQGYDYLSVWMVAKYCHIDFHDAFGSVWIQKGLHRRLRGEPHTLVSFVDAVPAEQIYPGNCKRRSREKVEEDARLQALRASDLRPRRVARQPTGGIKAQVGLPALRPKPRPPQRWHPPAPEEGPGLYGEEDGLGGMDSTDGEEEAPPDRPDLIVEPIASDNDGDEDEDERPTSSDGPPAAPLGDPPLPPPPEPPLGDAPLPPQPEPPEGELGAARRHTVDRYPRVYHPLNAGPYGWHGLRLVQSEELGWYDITAYCGYHPRCTKKTTLKKRPIGFLWAWLSCAAHEHLKSQQDHLKTELCHDKEVRLAARTEFSLLEGVDVQEWFRAERPPHLGEGDEPEVWR